MTLAAAKKLILKLPLNKRLEIAAEISAPALPGSVGLEELERRADEVLSGKEKGILWEEFERELKAMERSIKRAPASGAAGPARKSPKRTLRRRA